MRYSYKLSLIAPTAMSALLSFNAHADLQFPQSVDIQKGTLFDTQSVASYDFENTGKTIVEVLGVGTSCGCTSGQFQKKYIKPGEKSQIILTYDYKDRFGHQTANATVKTREWSKMPVIIKSDPQKKNSKIKIQKTKKNDQPKPLKLNSYRLRFNVQIPQPAKLSRNLFLWHPTRRDQLQKLNLEIKHDKPVKILKITSTQNIIQAKSVYNKKFKHYEITLTLDQNKLKTLKNGGRCVLIIETNLPGRYKTYKERWTPKLGQPLKVDYNEL